MPTISLETKVNALFALALLSVLALGGLQYRNAHGLTNDNQWASHSREVLRELESSKTLLNRAEASTKGFAISGDSNELPPYTRASGELRAKIQNLRELTTDNPVQQRRMNVLESRVQGALRAFQDEVTARPDRTLAAASFVSLEKAVQKASNDAQTVIGEMQSEEFQLLRQRNETTNFAIRQSNLFILLGSLAAFSLLGAAAIALRLDIAERRQSEAKFRGLLESAPDAMVIIDQTGRIVLINAQTERVFGYDRKEMLGQRVEMLLPERFREQHAGHRTGYFEAPQARPMGNSLELYALRRDGTEFPVQISLSPLKTGGRTLVSSAIRDTTEQKNRELTLRQLSGRLLQSQDGERRRIAREFHDSVGQYLAAAKMQLHSLKSKVSGTDREAQEHFAECAQLVDQAITEVRTLSYLLYPPLLDDVGLPSAASEYIDGFAKRSGIQTTVEISPNFGRVRRDVELSVFRVLQESLTNVHRHSGSATAGVRLVRNNGLVTLEVSDSGKGMPAASLEEFQKDLAGSLGVGLRGMRERITQLGGTLHVASNAQGTTVSATLPSTEELPRAVTGE
jgi:PAS domain S-box-containing protein